MGEVIICNERGVIRSDKQIITRLNSSSQLSF